MNGTGRLFNFAQTASSFPAQSKRRSAAFMLPIARGSGKSAPSSKEHLTRKKVSLNDPATATS
jgi:hypothetical protein